MKKIIFGILTIVLCVIVNEHLIVGRSYYVISRKVFNNPTAEEKALEEQTKPVITKVRVPHRNGTAHHPIVTSTLSHHQRQHYKSSCAEAAKNSPNGVYNIVIPSYNKNQPFPVFCDNSHHDGQWTVVLRRFIGGLNFIRKWDEYQSGFGNFSGDFFIGLDKLYALTSLGPSQELLILMRNEDGIPKYAHYSSFSIGNEEDGYRLKDLGQFSGNVHDSLRYHLGAKFTTYDNDQDDSLINCARKYPGAWWFKKCYQSHLFSADHGVWTYYTSDDNLDDGSILQYVQILIRPASVRASKPSN